MERPPKGTNGASPTDADVAQALERLGVPLEQLKKVVRTLEPEPKSPVDRVSHHVRRYLPLYALGTVWALMMVLVPTVNERGGPGSASTIARTGGSGAGDLSQPGGDVVATDQPSVPGAAGPAAAGQVVRRTTGAKGPGGPIGPVLAGAGITRGGFDCKPGVRQIPYSEYATNCIGKFDGNNGGATWRGVTADKIRIGVRATSDAGGPNGQAVDEINRQAGLADRKTALEIRKTYVSYLNKVMELYGRQVELVYWEGQGNGTSEAQSQGGETACSDAKKAKEQGFFANIAYTTAGIESQPFAECAKENQLFLPNAAAYFPEQFYQRWHPYVWGTVMECERISTDVAEYAGKRLAHKKAKWAGSTVYQNTTRAFGTYVPNNDGYQRCVKLSEEKLERDYNTKVAKRVDYILDVSRFADQAQAAVVSFKAAGVTTLINACDPYSTIFLTQAADAQDWHPEWLLIGVAAQDTKGFGRLYQQTQVNGHMFGMSQLGNDAKINDPNGEATRIWKLATGKNDAPPNGATLTYYGVLDIFNKLQASGPTLTPDNLAAGIRKLPPGGVVAAPVGRWSYVDDHTAIDDSREIYWVSDEGPQTPCSKCDFRETYGGKRFRSGEWPAEDPPIYPK